MGGQDKPAWTACPPGVKITRVGGKITRDSLPPGGQAVQGGKINCYTGIRLLLLIHLFISSFFFLSNFQTLKFFVTLFSGTMRPRRLKLGTIVDSGQMYRVYRNQAATACSSLYFFIFLSPQFSSIKNFRHTFLRNCEA